MPSRSSHGDAYRHVEFLQADAVDSGNKSAVSVESAASCVIRSNDVSTVEVASSDDALTNNDAPTDAPPKSLLSSIMRVVAGADSGEQSGDTSLRGDTITSHAVNDELTCAASVEQRSCDGNATDNAAVPGNIMLTDDTNLEATALCVVFVVSALNINVHQHVVGTANPITTCTCTCTCIQWCSFIR